MNALSDWAFSHIAEIAAAASGLIYILFSIRQLIYTWPAGIITSILYCWVFFEAKLYAVMWLQCYYVIISVYGWWSWLQKGQTGPISGKLHVSCTKSSLWFRLFILNLLLILLFYLLLVRYTDSPMPGGDAIITSLSVIATWMLARKKIEHWLIWIFVDVVCIVLYLYRGLYPTVFLFVVYTVMAGAGFYEWRKERVELT
jgi:nicotinamide mononucleotide transporter